MPKTISNARYENYVLQYSRIQELETAEAEYIMRIKGLKTSLLRRNDLILQKNNEILVWIKRHKLLICSKGGLTLQNKKLKEKLSEADSLMACMIDDAIEETKRHETLKVKYELQEKQLNESLLAQKILSKDLQSQKEIERGLRDVIEKLQQENKSLKFKKENPERPTPEEYSEVGRRRLNQRKNVRKVK